MPRNLILVLILLITACSSKSLVSLVDSNTPAPDIVTVLIPEDIAITRINDQKFSQLLGSTAKGYHLNPGTHLIELRYDRLWELDADNHHIVKSDIIKMEWDLEPGKTYELKFDQTNNYEASKKLAKNFSPWLVASTTANTLTNTSSNVAITKNKPEKTKPIAEKSNNKKIDSYQLKQLKTWWSRSSKTDRQQFLNWITDNQ